MSTIKVNTIENRTGSSITIGGSSTTSLNLASTITGGTLTMTPLFSAYRTSSGQSITTATLTKVQFNAENYDPSNTFDSSTNYRFTPTTAGYYCLQSSLGYQGTITRVILLFYKNGSEYQRGADLNITGATIISGTSTMYMNGSTDYAEVYAYATGSGITVVNQKETFFQGFKLIGA